MAEIGSAVTRRNLTDQAAAVQGIGFECFDIHIGLLFFQDMIIHIEQGSSQVFDCGKTLSVLAALHDLVDQFLRNDLAGFVMFGIYFQYFRFKYPMFVHLRRQFNKVARNISNAIIVNVTEQAMQGMSEFVENRFRFIGTQQGRLSGSRFAEVEDSRHNRIDALAILISLRTVTTAPGTAALAGTCVEVHVEDTQRAAVFVLAFECIRIGIGLRYILDFGEGDTVQFICHIESTVTHMVEFQVRTHFVFIHIEFSLACLIGIITPVPAFGIEVTALFPDLGVDVGQFFLRLFQSRSPHLVEQVIYVLFVLRHILFQHVSGKVFVTQQFRFVEAGGNQLFHDFLVIILVAVIATVDISLEDLFTQSTVIGILQERHHARVMQRENPFPFHRVGSGCFGSSGNQRFGQACQVFLLVDNQLECIGFFQHILAESKFQHGDLLVQLTQLGLVVGIQVGPSAYESFVGFFQQLLLFLIQTERSLVVINSFHTGKESRVQADIIRMGGEKRIEFLLQLLYLVGGIHTRLSSESIQYFIQ